MEFTFKFKTFNGIEDQITVGGQDEAKAFALARGYIKRRYGADSVIELVRKEDDKNVDGIQTCK